MIDYESDSDDEDESAKRGLISRWLRLKRVWFGAFSAIVLYTILPGLQQGGASFVGRRFDETLEKIYQGTTKDQDFIGPPAEVALDVPPQEVQPIQPPVLVL